MTKTSHVNPSPLLPQGVQSSSGAREVQRILPETRVTLTHLHPTVVELVPVDRLRGAHSTPVLYSTSVLCTPRTPGTVLCSDPSRLPLSLSLDDWRFRTWCPWSSLPLYVVGLCPSAFNGGGFGAVSGGGWS